MTAAQTAGHRESAGWNSANALSAARGQRVLVVEREGRLAASVRDTLERAGYRVEGPAVAVAQALACLERARPDAAILDLDLSGGWSAPVARELGRQGLPFFLLTNHPCPGFLDAAYDQAWRLERPFTFAMASAVAAIGPTPLGLGTFEASCVLTLRLFEIPLESALAATLLFRGLISWLPMLPGLWLARRELCTGG